MDEIEFYGCISGNNRSSGRSSAGANNNFSYFIRLEWYKMTKETELPKKTLKEIKRRGWITQDVYLSAMEKIAPEEKPDTLSDVDILMGLKSLRQAEVFNDIVFDMLKDKAVEILMSGASPSHANKEEQWHFKGRKQVAKGRTNRFKKGELTAYVEHALSEGKTTAPEICRQVAERAGYEYNSLQSSVWSHLKQGVDLGKYNRTADKHYSIKRS